MKEKLILVLFSVVGLFSACKDDNTQEEESFTLNNVYYYDYYDTFKYVPIVTDDTVKSKVGRTLAITLETSSDQIIVQASNQNAVEIEEIESISTLRVFHIYFKQSCMVVIDVIDNLTNKFVSFHVNVSPLTILFSTVSSTQVAYDETLYTIVAEDETIKETIVEELKNKYSLKKGELTYTSTTEGEIEATMGDEGNIVKGSFTKQSLSDQILYQISYNEKVYNITATQSESNSNGYTIVQDLTDEFREKYPSAVIDKVEISSFVLTNYLRQLVDE